jgi:hypothetical protein
MAVAPAPVMAVSPADLFGLETVHFVPRDNGGTGIFIRRRQPSILRKRLRQQRRGLRARGERNRTRGKSDGEFQKVAAFHDIFLLVLRRVMHGEFECVEMNGA